MPSSTKAYIAMVQLADETGLDTIIDLGSGWGNFIIPMARRAPDKAVIGYELSVLPWFFTNVLIKLLRLKNLNVYRQDFFKVTLPTDAALVCYLYPQAMEKLSEKLNQEDSTKKTRYLISNNFALPSKQANKIIKLDDFYQSPIYFYKN